MPGPSDSRMRKLLLGLLPADGESVGNGKLHELFDAAVESAQYKVGNADFEKVRDALVTDGSLLRGKGRGGSVRRALVLEVKGEDSGQNRAKRSALDAWVKGVNSKGGFGAWCWDVAFQPAQMHDIVQKHGAA